MTRWYKLGAIVYRTREEAQQALADLQRLYPGVVFGEIKVLMEVTE